MEKETIIVLVIAVVFVGILIYSLIIKDLKINLLEDEINQLRKDNHKLRNKKSN